MQQGPAFGICPAARFVVVRKLISTNTTLSLAMDPGLSPKIRKLFQLIAKTLSKPVIQKKPLKSHTHKIIIMSGA